MAIAYHNRARQARRPPLHPRDAHHRLRCPFYLAAGMTVPEILDDFPYLTKEDIQACFAFAAERERNMQVNVA
jgi:hypothetical protein